MDNQIDNKSNTNRDEFKNTPQVSAPDNDINQSLDTNFAQGSSGSTGASYGGIGSKMSDVKNRIVNQAGPAVDYLKNNFSGVGTKAQGYTQNVGSMVRQYPFYSLLGAVAIGAFIGMAIAKPSSDNINSMNRV